MAHDVQVSFIRVLLKVCKKNKGLIIIISLHVCNVVQSLNWLVTVQLYRYSVHLHFHCTCGRGIQAIWQVWRIYTVWHGKNQTHFTHNYFRNVCTHGPYLRKNWELVWREDVKNIQRVGGIHFFGGGRGGQTVFTDMTERCGNHPWVMATKYDGFVVWHWKRYY